MKKERAMTFISLLYIILPIILFCFGWLKPIATLLSVAFLFLFAKTLLDELSDSNIQLLCRQNILILAISVLVSALWVHLSGIGGMMYQNMDFWARNAVYRDLCTHRWPVIFDLSKERASIQTIMGNSKVAFSYYFTWWLVPAAICKLFNMGDMGRNIVLYCWALLGILLIFYNLYQYFQCVNFKILICFICFSGLDVIGYITTKGSIPHTEHIEWWSQYYQYSSNTTMLFWVFNQVIPLWLILILFLRLTKKDCAYALVALSFAYSPWATIGTIPFVIYNVTKDVKKYKEWLSVHNVFISLMIMIIYGIFYKASSGSSGITGWIWNLYPMNDIVYFYYILFVFLEFVIFLIVMGRQALEFRFYFVVLFTLLFLPLYRYVQYSSLIRGSIPALFLLNLFCIKFLLINNHNDSLKTRKKILILLLIIGAITPYTEVSRSINNKLNNPDEILRDDVYSLETIRTDNDEILTEIKNQFFIYDYEETFFFKYLAK